MRKHRTRSAAFTLAEILVVIAIISVLAAFLLPAVMKSRLAAERGACVSQISALGLALDQFQNDFGYYPPTTNAFNSTTGKFDGVAFGAYGYSEALVHCLCNQFTVGSGDAAYKGTNHKIGNSPVNGGPYFEVKKAKLIDLDNDGWPELADPWGNPIIYIPRDDYLDAAGTGYNAGALVKNPDGTNPDPTRLTTGSPPLNDHYRRFTYQLISRGPDGWTPGIDPTNKYAHITLAANPYPPFNPSLVGTDTDLSHAVTTSGHTEETADDINNW